MRALNARVLMAGLVVVVGACSEPPATVSVDEESELAAELELALFSARPGNMTEEGVVSELELGRPRAPEAAAAAPPAVPVPTPAPPKAEPAREVRLAGSVAAETMPDDDAPVSIVGSDGDEATGAEGIDEAAGGPEVGRPASGPRPGIIIRGGGTGHDPCVIHLPGMGPRMGGGILTGLGDGGVGIGIDTERDPRGSIGVAVNDQTPRGVGREAFAPRNRGRVPSFGGGRSFPGGIR